ncbi:MAG: hypothetical protein R3F37_01910 [Candidatus Competibacteraceae bacterium]
MPDFHKVSTGRAAWSDAHNTSQRITTGSAKRPEAEVKLKGRNIEIHTGARVTRARGPWVGFKKMFTAAGHGISEKLHAIGLHGPARSQKVINDRKMRHAEHQFDRHVNRLVEDLANKPDLSPADVSKRFNKLAEQAKIMQTLNPNLSDRALAERFEKNFNESLQVVAQHKPEALNRVVNAFGRGGKLHDIKNEYTFYNDPDKAGLQAADRHEQSKPDNMYTRMHGKQPPMTAANYVNSGIVDPEEWSDAKQAQHAFGQQLISKMSGTLNTVPDIRRQATASALKGGLATGNTYKGTVSKDFIQEQVKVDKTLVTDHIRDRINENKMNNSAGYDLQEHFLNDVSRSSMTFTEANGQSVELRQQLQDNNIDPNTIDGAKQAKQMAGDQMLQFAEGDKIAAKNLSRLMHQHVIRSLTGAGTMEFNKDYDAMLASGKEKVAHKVTKQANGDVILESTKSSSVNAINASGKFYHVDPAKDNSINESIKIRIRKEDLGKEPLQYELLEAKTHYNFDTTGAKPN